MGKCSCGGRPVDRLTGRLDSTTALQVSERCGQAASDSSHSAKSRGGRSNPQAGPNELSVAWAPGRSTTGRDLGCVRDSGSNPCFSLCNRPR